MSSQKTGGAGACGCLAFFRTPRARTCATNTPTQDESHVVIRQQVQDLVAAEMRSLEDTLSSELQSVLVRLLKVDAQPSSPTAAQAVDDAALPLHNRSMGKRRWTCAADGADSLSAIVGRVAHAEAEDRSPRSEAELQSRRDSTSSAGQQDEALSFERPFSRCNSDGGISMKSGSSVNWRIDALDCGDRLAASAAARKGTASVDSIVALVASERERWVEERSALEARLEELKERRQAFHQRPDAEKEELRRQVQELRETMKMRSRFGAWVCERHMQESDDEEESPSNLEKEQLRGVLAGLEAELREARVQAAVATMEP
mmetsp:Transcript_34746/g.108242  ORF Transcript_34746/g.108242 Transcript_34746/m.108242 type:complete len:318 (-) Transcript_34746:60-1013(-)